MAHIARVGPEIEENLSLRYVAASLARSGEARRRGRVARVPVASERCVDPAVDSGTSCTLEQQKYDTTYTPTDSNGGANPWCDVDAGDWDGGSDAGCSGGGGPSFSFSASGGCRVANDCSSAGNGGYVMTCDGTTCACTTGPTATGTFAQGTSCDTGTTMRTAFVQKCTFPNQK